MASNILSRLLPSASDEASVYDTAQRSEHRRLSNNSAEPAGLDVDEENLGERFQEQDLEHLLADATADSRLTSESTAFAFRDKAKVSAKTTPPEHAAPKWHESPAAPTVNDRTVDDDDVPESLLLEGHQEMPTERRRNIGETTFDNEGLPPPVPGPSTRRTRAQWETARAQQRLHNDTRPETGRRTRPNPPTSISRPVQDPRERAMWMWVNVQDLDRFLYDVYGYFLGHGMWSILLSRLLVLLQTAFVAIFSIFVAFFIDYSAFSKSEHLREIIYENPTSRIHGFWKAVLVGLMALWAYVFYQYLVDIPRLKGMHDFYHHLLDIPDRDIQTVSWQHVVGRLMALRDSNVTTAGNVSNRTRGFLGTQAKQRMDAHDIANRLMRRENYLIAMFNKDILDLSFPIPFIGNRQFFSKTTEWHVNVSILDFVFNQRNQVDRIFLTDRHRRQLIETLKRRFVLTGIVSIVWAPFTVPYFALSYFFRYFTEFQKEPARLAMRSFTPLAEWKFREFNELQHLFERRRNMSYPYADRYLQMFPKDKFEQLCAFAALVTGAPASVLIIATLLDEKLLLGFEIAWGKNVLFFITILTTIFTIASRSISQDDIVLDPKLALTHVIECTHYCPSSWRDQLHSNEVRKEFTSLYQWKIVIFLEELMSMIITPFILMTRLPQCSERIIDFFREFTVHIDGLGTVCSFAVFEFDLGGDNIARKRVRQGQEDPNLRDEYYSTRDGKMMASYQNFLDAYGDQKGRSPRQGPGIAKSGFYPPPTFSSFTISANPGHRHASRPVTARSRSRAARGPVMNSVSSPMHSVLLDLHHQPSASGAQHSPRQPSHGRFRSSRYRAGADDLDETAETSSSMPLHNLSNTARAIEEDSHLGDSWRTGDAGRPDVEDDDELDPEAKGGGVLDLLYQYQRAQTEGRKA